MLSLAGASLAACIQLPFVHAPDPTNAEPEAAEVVTMPADGPGARIYIASSDAEAAADLANADGLDAYPLSVGGTFVMQRRPIRALPELRPTRLGGPWLSVASPELPEALSALFDFGNEEPGLEEPGDEGEETDSEIHADLSGLPRGTMVLHVGDSFAGALGVPLGHRLRRAGLRSVLQFKKASYIPTWAFGDVLRINIARHKPDLVLVSLGANEIELRRPTQRVYAIRRLVQTMGERPCVWISPPMWKPDAGLLDVIRENIAPCRYLDTDALVPHMPRGPDRIHPSLRGREIWADAVLDWLSRERDPRGDQPWQLKDAQRYAPSARSEGGFPARQAAQP